MSGEEQASLRLMWTDSPEPAPSIPSRLVRHADGSALLITEYGFYYIPVPVPTEPTERTAP